MAVKPPTTDDIDEFLILNKWLPLSSSHIKGAMYNPMEQTMVVEFKDGAFYRYLDVSPSEARGFVSAGSHGKYLHQHFIKTNKAWVRVSAPTSGMETAKVRAHIMENET